MDSFRGVERFRERLEEQARARRAATDIGESGEPEKPQKPPNGNDDD
jgi:hypothetical protein